ncbi:phosphoribosyltransferase family protein [Microbispora sp. NPDC049125]|uniref:phosphoribosyltransferase family protein n=1 Tax=Microbispora sp. NPDC049125 TaxID=3154929 RepID=UPI003466C718
MTVTAPWPGQWVADRLGVTLSGMDRPLGADVAHLAGLAVRRNPRRAHLLVSTVLGKHIPADPRLVYSAGRLLGMLAHAALTGGQASAGASGPASGSASGSASGPASVSASVRALAEPFAEPFAAALRGRPGAAAELRRRLDAAPRTPYEAVVVGYAETATALGHCVADTLVQARYLHSTRRTDTGISPYGRFEEEHSHATTHLLLPGTDDLLGDDLPMVLVDDELSTGTTVINTIRALHSVRARRHYVVASLIDLRGPEDVERMNALARETGARVDVVALATGRISVPSQAIEEGGRLVAALSEGHEPVGIPAEAAPVRRVALEWPAGVPSGGRHGFTPAHRARLEAALPRMAGGIAGELRDLKARRVLVLGSEELMYVPLRLALALGDSGAEVRYSSTTRSPVLAVDDPGYAVRTRLAFPAHDVPAGGAGERYAYNVAGGRFDAVVVVVDDVADTPDLTSGLLSRLSREGLPVLLVSIPAHPPEER